MEQKKIGIIRIRSNEEDQDEILKLKKAEKKQRKFFRISILINYSTLQRNKEMLNRCKKAAKNTQIKIETTTKTNKQCTQRKGKIYLRSHLNSLTKHLIRDLLIKKCLVRQLI